MDRTKYQYEGMKWLVELELLNHPQVVNTIKMNIFSVSKSIKEVELLIYRENKTMLVLLELGWFGRTFNKKDIFSDVHEILSQLLPSFRFRVTDDPEIMKLAIERVKQALTGGARETVNLNPSVVPDLPSSPKLDQPPISSEPGIAADPKPSQEEQRIIDAGVFSSVSADDIGSIKKT